MSAHPSAVPTVQIDDALVRVTEWRFAPAAATGWHRHEYPYVVVPMTTGRLAITGAGGATRPPSSSPGGRTRAPPVSSTTSRTPTPSSSSSSRSRSRGPEWRARCSPRGLRAAACVCRGSPASSRGPGSPASAGAATRSSTTRWWRGAGGSARGVRPASRSRRSCRGRLFQHRRCPRLPPRRVARRAVGRGRARPARRPHPPRAVRRLLSRGAEPDARRGHARHERGRGRARLRFHRARHRRDRPRLALAAARGAVFLLVGPLRLNTALVIAAAVPIGIWLYRPRRPRS